MYSTFSRIGLGRIESWTKLELPCKLATQPRKPRQRLQYITIRSGSSHTNDESSKNSKKSAFEPVNASVSGRTKLRSIAELMRWHSPSGVILTLAPALWSVGLATPDTSLIPDLKTMGIFTAGAIVARGMGCTINDILDRNFDKHVDRTKMRPIACGDISVKEALVYLSVQSFVGLYILCLNNIAVIKLGLFSGIMIASYPLFKRFTNWPQVMLALTFNWGVIMGYAAIKGSVLMQDMSSLLPLYLAANLWTLYYDTVYAHQDKIDDLSIGVKSSALALGSCTTKFLYQMSGGMFTSLLIAGVMTSQMWPYYLAISSSGLAHAYQVRSLDLDNRDQCWRVFSQQKYIGLMILVGILASVALKARRHELGRTHEEIEE